MTNRMVMIDTGCAPTRAFVDNHNLSVMGMKLVLDGKEYWDWHEMAPDDYYSIIDSVGEFYTRPPTLWDVFDRYEEVRDQGVTELVAIHLSSKMSQTIDICRRAAKMVNGLTVKIIDTRSVSAGAYLLAEKVISLLEAGRTYEETVARLPEIEKSTLVQFSVPSVKYLVRNGRIGKAQAFAALVMKIKPVLGVEDGLVAPLAKEKGVDKALKRMSDNAFKFLKKRRHNVKIHIGYGFDQNKDLMEQVYRRFRERFDELGISDYAVIRSRMMPTVACHSGPDVFGIAVYGEKKPIH